MRQLRIRPLASGHNGPLCFLRRTGASLPQPMCVGTPPVRRPHDAVQPARMGDKAKPSVCRIPAALLFWLNGHFGGRGKAASAERTLFQARAVSGLINLSLVISMEVRSRQPQTLRHPAG
jgi:hypothetical protein